MTHYPIIDGNVLNKIPDNVEGITILDIAFGKGYWGFNIRTNKQGNPILVGLEISKEYIRKQKEMKIYNEFILSDVRFLPIKSNSFKIVIACEIIEHLDRKEGIEFLNNIEKLGKKIVVSTPKGFWETKGSIGFDRHISGWEVEDF
jgi:ubiquinone/menaquinone biosynthesis C-methylase UbiE